MNTLRGAMLAKGWSIDDLRRAVNVRLADAGHEQVEYEAVRRWTLPVGEKLHRTPGRVAMAALLGCFEGEVSADVFYPPLGEPPVEVVSHETLHGGA